MPEVLQTRFDAVAGKLTEMPPAHVTLDGKSVTLLLGDDKAERDFVWASVVESGRRFDTGDLSAPQKYCQGIKRILELDGLINSEYKRKE